MNHIVHIAYSQSPGAETLRGEMFCWWARETAALMVGVCSLGRMFFMWVRAVCGDMWQRVAIWVEV